MCELNYAVSPLLLFTYDLTEAIIMFSSSYVYVNKMLFNGLILAIM